MKEILKRELRVAFHKQSQPVWVRIVKYVVLGLFVYFFRDSPAFWWIIGAVFIGAFALHGFYRYKTRGWTRSYGEGVFRWDYEKIFGEKID